MHNTTTGASTHATPAYPSSKSSSHIHLASLHCIFIQLLFTACSSSLSSLHIHRVSRHPPSSSQPHIHPVIRLPLSCSSPQIYRFIRHPSSYPSGPTLLSRYSSGPTLIELTSPPNILRCSSIHRSQRPRTPSIELDGRHNSPIIEFRFVARRAVYRG